MNTISALRKFMTSGVGRATWLSIVTLAGIAGTALLYCHVTRAPEASGAAVIPAYAGSKDRPADGGHSDLLSAVGTQLVTISKDRAQSMGLKTAPARRGNWPERLRVTGRLELNESRVAHVSPLVDGVVREVPVELGQTVKRGEVLAYVDSREVGDAKLKLVKDQLQLTSARQAGQWYEAIHENTSALLEALEKGETLNDIEGAFRDRPVGAYRQQLVSALARLTKAEADFERIRRLGEDAIIPKKEVIRSRAEHEAAEATYRALMEQIRFDVQRHALDARQRLQAAEAAVAISRSHLLILGYGQEDIDLMDPIKEGERVAYYPIRSPIGGTIIAKQAPLSKYVDGQSELFRIADLSTIWLRADVFEKDLDATARLEGKPVMFEAGSYPGRRFTADIFSLGDLIDDKTRAIRLLAMVDNSERLLKPGMFVEIELTSRNDADVLQLPASAIQRHAGTPFVFVCEAEGFQRRGVTLGRSTSHTVEVIAGLADGESVVVEGGFALKSEMLSDLMGEE